MTLADLEATATAMRARSRPDRVVCDFVKIFVDGVLDSTTAFMLEDYEGQPGNKGLPLFTQAQMDEAVILADRLGFQVAVHSIGDAGVRRTLDAYATARSTNGPRDSRHRVEHIELSTPPTSPLQGAGCGRLDAAAARARPRQLPRPRDDGAARRTPRPFAFAWRTLREAGAACALPATGRSPQSIRCSQFRRP